jgi:hypothetical protein
MDLQVGISDLASPDPRGAFVVSGTAKFVLQKSASERDINKTAEQFVKIRTTDQLMSTNRQWTEVSISFYKPSFM